ncbi:hypothetical protein ACH5RR_007439 [Cinchona calisaya]|uniref:Uncharacterized protein n=1 Tax=Cinchona calisaya TaxID=153742 RepID=A0ABD3ART5_9GENT
MKIKFRSLAALFALIFIHILMGSSLFLQFHHDPIGPLSRSGGGRSHSRKLLQYTMATMQTNSSTQILGGAVKEQPKKAVEQSLKKAPPSTFNPIQN